jgi:hypothetical protein
MAAYPTAIMNDDIEKFEYDSMQQRTKKTKFIKGTSLTSCWVSKAFNIIN